MGKGRRSKRKHKQQGNRQPTKQGNKRQKRTRCWIEECPETENDGASAERQEVDVRLLISRVLLFDEHSSSRVDVKSLVKNSEKKKPSNKEDGNIDNNNVCENEGVSSASPENEAAGDSAEPAKTEEKEQYTKSDNVDTAISHLPLKSNVDVFDGTKKKVENHGYDVTSKPSTLGQVESLFKASSPKNNAAEDFESLKEAKSQEIIASSSAHSAEGHEPSSSWSPAVSAPIDLPKLKNARISVRRHASARGPVKFTRTGFVHLPNGDCGDGITNPHPDTVEDKYWAQRHRLFNRFEQGIKLDREGWFSVTPEAIANHLASKIVSHSKQRAGMVVLDAFCGVGGNAIAFARRKEVSLVLCVDTDKTRLELAANNCRVYGIPKEKLLFVCADAVDVLKCYRNGKKLVDKPNPLEKEEERTDGDFCDHGCTFASIDQIPSHIDAVFLSPPWGGSEYANQRHFDLESMRINDEVNGDDLFRLGLQSMSKELFNLAYFVPRNTNGWRIGQSAYRSGIQSLEMEQNYLNNKLKTITLYARNEAA